MKVLGAPDLTEFDDAIRAELFNCFHALQDSYSELVRMSLQSYEARAMMA